MKTIREKLAKLIDVKSIVTMLLTVIFCIQVLRGGVDNSDFQSIFLMVMAFYFGTQAQKKKNSTEVTSNE